MINCAVIYEDSDKIFVEFNNNPGLPLSLDVINRKTIETIYPNHLRQVKGYRHRILIAEEIPHLKLVNGEVRAKFAYFLKAVAQMENSIIEFINMANAAQEQFVPAIKYAYENRIMEISLIRSIGSDEVLHQNQLLTYEELAICTLVPRSKGIFRVFSFIRVKL